MKYTLNTADVKKIGIGAGIAVAGALLTYLTQVISETDFGVYTPIVVAGFSVVANIVRKFIADHS